MTKAEISGQRPLGFSRWSREVLRDSSTGLIWTDIDCLFQDYKKNKIMLIECKTNNGKVSWSQRQQLELLDRLLQLSAPDQNLDYWGFYIIRMDGDSPETSKWIRINGQPIGKESLIKHLNFEQKYQCESVM